jgi:hypothetical protein
VDVVVLVVADDQLKRSQVDGIWNDF